MSAPPPILLLIAPGEGHVFDRALHEALITEGYHCHVCCEECPDLADLAAHSLVIVSAGAAAKLPVRRAADYLAQGGRLIVFQPPADWGPLLGLQRLQSNYATARDAFIAIEPEHPWLADFPWLDLQCPGHNHVWANESAQVLAWTAGQLAERSAYPAVAANAAGNAVVFTYDLADVLVRLQQGRPELASPGADPDANRDGKFGAEDAFEGQRRFDLRHVPQADVHRDLLVRVIRGLTADGPPLPRLWHFPHAVPGLLFLDGDGDAMTWEDLELVVATVEEFAAKYTLYMMEAEIAAFDPVAVAALQARGHDFGPHPWTGFQPTPEAWAAEVGATNGRLRRKFDLEPVALRTHCIIMPGWDEAPRALSRRGLRLDTNFCNGFRFQSGYLNGSALLTRFFDRQGLPLDCYEQSTVQMEDGAGSPKVLLPVQTQEQALALSRRLLDDLAGKYHGVFHPYFHPINLGGRGAVPCLDWFRGVLAHARDLGMTSVNAREWLRFTEGRAQAQVTSYAWDGETERLSFSLTAPEDLAGLTVLLPPCCDRLPQAVSVSGQPAEAALLPYENGRWTALTVDVTAGQSLTITIAYRVVPED
jgi:hypothetical protein